MCVQVRRSGGIISFSLPQQPVANNVFIIICFVLRFNAPAAVAFLEHVENRARLTNRVPVLVTYPAAWIVAKGWNKGLGQIFFSDGDIIGEETTMAMEGGGMKKLKRHVSNEIASAPAIVDGEEN